LQLLGHEIVIDRDVGTKNAVPLRIFAGIGIGADQEWNALVVVNDGVYEVATIQIAGLLVLISLAPVISVLVPVKVGPVEPFQASTLQGQLG